MIKYIINTIFCLMLIGCGSKEEPTHHRPNGIPEKAIWAGGEDGGSWFHCMQYAHGGSYTCEIYNDYDGSLVAKGNFLKKTVTWNESTGTREFLPAKQNTEITIKYFDGELIHLQSRQALVPHGQIKYPVSDKETKVRTFEDGIPVGEEKTLSY